MNENNKKSDKFVVELDNYEYLIDDELKEKIKNNKYENVKKSTVSVVIVRIISVISLLISAYYLYTLHKPFVNAITSHNTNLLLQICIYGVIIIINIFAAIKLFMLNNLGRIILFIVLFIFIALRIFEIFYKNLNYEQYKGAIYSIVIAGIIAIIMMIKPISKAF